MKRSSTIFLRAVVVLIALIVLGLCLFVLPAGISSDATEMYHPILWGMYATAIPFFIALHQTLKLLGYIDKTKAFSQVSVKTLKTIKYCALAISGLYAVGLPYIFFVADKDDAPGAVLIGLVFTLGSLVVAVFAAVLERLLQNAINIKSENDLTV